MALRTEMDFRPDHLAPRQARTFVATFVRACGLADLVDRTKLLTREVVSNAIVQADSPIRLVLEAHSSSVVMREDHPSSLALEVKDTARTPVAVDGEEVADADRGRGMVLVDALSDRWRWWKEEDGKVVWSWSAGRVMKERIEQHMGTVRHRTPLGENCILKCVPPVMAAAGLGALPR